MVCLLNSSALLSVKADICAHLLTQLWSASELPTGCWCPFHGLHHGLRRPACGQSSLNQAAPCSWLPRRLLMHVASAASAGYDSQ